MSDEASELSREELLQRYGKKLPGPSTATRRSPFKFLDSYDASDADIFFGRDSEITELLRHYQSYGHVLIYGESGSGKSSLVQCGLRSRIPESDALFIPLRVNASGLSAVSRQICEAASLALAEPVEVPPQSGLVDTLRAVVEAASRPVVLFFDQFEELFIFHDAETRRKFAEQLAAIPTSKLNAKVIIGVRQDYLAHLSELEDTVEGLFDNRFWLRRMSRENAVQAVVKACSTCDVRIDEALAESIIQRLDPSAHGIELPYLQVVMDRLYRQAVEQNLTHPVITAEEVQKLGDIANILGSFLIEEVAKLPAPDTGRQILKAFVTREATRRTLDRAAVAQESAGFGGAIPPDVLDAHLNQLTSVRILREVADSGTYELRHDALAATVSSWISEVEKELIEVRDNLVNRFKEYEARDRDKTALLDQGFLDYLSVYRKRLTPLLNEKLRDYLHLSQRRVEESRRLQRRVTQIVTSSVLTVMVACLIIAVWKWIDAVHAKEVAVSARGVAETEKARADENAISAAQREQEAKDNLDVANRAVQTMLTEVGSESLKDVPQMETIRAKLLSEALELFQGMATRTPEDAKSRLEVALAHYRIAQVLRIRLAEGDKDEAEKHFSMAIDALKKLADEDDGNSEYPRQLANCYNYKGVLLSKSEKKNAKLAYAEALRVQKELIAQLEKAKGEQQILSDVKQELARTRYNQGILLSESDVASDKEEARQAYQEAARILEELVKSEPQAKSRARREQGLARAYNLLGTESEESAKSEQYNKAIGILKELLEADKNNREYKLELTAYYSNLANVLNELEKSEEAVAAADNAIRLSEQLAAATPTVGKAMANAYNTKGMVLHKSKPQDAEEAYVKANEIFASLKDSLSEDTEYQEWYLNSQINLALLLGEQKQFEAAIELYSEATRKCFEVHNEDERCKKCEDWNINRAIFAARFIAQLNSDVTLSDEQRGEELKKLKDFVVDFLENAKDWGFDDVEGLKAAANKDGEFEAISGCARFQLLLETLQTEKR